MTSEPMARARRFTVTNAETDTSTEGSNDSKPVRPCSTEAISNNNLDSRYMLRIGAPQLPEPAAAVSAQSPLPDSVRIAPKTVSRNPVARTADGGPTATGTAAATKAPITASCTPGLTSSHAPMSTFSQAHSEEQLAVSLTQLADTDAATSPRAGIAAAPMTNPPPSLTPLASNSPPQNNPAPSTTSSLSPPSTTTDSTIKPLDLNHHKSALHSGATATSTTAAASKVTPVVTFELPVAPITMQVHGTTQTGASAGSSPSRRATASDSGASVATDDVDSSEEAETMDAPLLSAYVAIMPSAGDAPLNEHIRLAAKRQRSSTDGPLRPTPRCTQGAAGVQQQQQQASLTVVASGHSLTAHSSAAQSPGVAHMAGSVTTTMGQTPELPSATSSVSAASLPSAVPQRRQPPQPPPHQQLQQPKRRTGDWDRLPSVSPHIALTDQALPPAPSVRVCSKRYSTPGTPAAVAATAAGCCKSDDGDDNENGDETGGGGGGGGLSGAAIMGSGGSVTCGLRLPPLRIASSKLRRSSVDGDRRLRPRPAGHSLFTDSQDEFDWQKFSLRALAVNGQSSASNLKGVPNLFNSRAADGSESPSPDFSPPIRTQCDKLVLTDPRDGADPAALALTANAVGSGHLRNDGTWPSNSVTNALSLRINVAATPGSPIRGTPTRRSSGSPNAPDEARSTSAHSPKALPIIPICAPPTRGPSFTALTSTTSIPSPSLGTSPAPPPLTQALSPLPSPSSSLPSISAVRLTPQNEPSPTLSAKALCPVTPASPKFHRFLPHPPPTATDASSSQPPQAPTPTSADSAPPLPYPYPHPSAPPAPQQSSQPLQTSPAGFGSDIGTQRRRQPAPPLVPRSSYGGRLSCVGEDGGHRASQS